MFNGQQLGCVMDRTVPVVVVADRAVEKVIAKNPVKCFPPCGTRLGGIRLHFHPGPNSGRACPDEIAVHLHHTGVTGLNGAELRVITHL